MTIATIIQNPIFTLLTTNTRVLNNLFG